MVAPVGGVCVRKAPLGPLALLELQLTLATVLLVLLADVLPHPGLIQTHRADPIPRCPEVQSRHPTFVKSLPMNPHGALALEKPDRVRHAVLGWDAQAQMDMIGHRMAFQELDAALATQLPQDQADPASQPPVEDLRRYFGIITAWYLHSHRTWDRLCHSCMGSSFLPHGAFLEVGAYAFQGGMHAGSLEALRVTRPEAVDLGSINL